MEEYYTARATTIDLRNMTSLLTYLFGSQAGIAILVQTLAPVRIGFAPN
jgi:hypothetical protein